MTLFRWRFSARLLQAEKEGFAGGVVDAQDRRDTVSQYGEGNGGEGDTLHHGPDGSAGNLKRRLISHPANKIESIAKRLVSPGVICRCYYLRLPPGRRLDQGLPVTQCVTSPICGRRGDS